MDRRCEAPSERVRELIRQGAKMTLDGSQQGLEALHQAVLASEYMRRRSGDRQGDPTKQSRKPSALGNRKR